MKHTPAPWKIRERKNDDLSKSMTYCFIDAEAQNLSVARILQSDETRSKDEAQ